MSNFFVKRDELKKSDAIVVLTGNGWERTEWAIKLYKQEWATLLVMIGSTGSRPSPEMAEFAEQFGIPKNKILIDTNSTNTRLNANNVVGLAQKYGWEQIILVTSPHHQLRSYLTFKKAIKDFQGHLKIINYPPLQYSWFELVESSRNKKHKVLRFFYLFSELYRILKYRIKGDL